MLYTMIEQNKNRKKTKQNEYQQIFTFEHRFILKIEYIILSY